MHLGRRIYVRFIRQQELQSFSVSFSRSFDRWGSAVLHKEEEWAMFNNTCFHVLYDW